MSNPKSRIDVSDPASYRESTQDNQFSYDTGVVVVPVASRAAAHRIIRLHGGVGMRRVKWSARRISNPPIIPAMQDTPQDTFLGGTVTPSLPTPSANKRGYDWAVAGEYVYVQNDPRVVGTDPLPVGQHPFVCFDQQYEAINALPRGAARAAYTQAGFDGLMAAAEAAVTINQDGTYLWPFLGHPTVFTSTNLIQG